MNKKPAYKNFSEDEMILRDHLAVDRTALANERTLLAYVRTALAFALAGVSIIHFLRASAYEIFGYILLLLSVAISLFGIRRYWRVFRLLRKAKI